MPRCGPPSPASLSSSDKDVHLGCKFSNLLLVAAALEARRGCLERHGVRGRGRLLNLRAAGEQGTEGEGGCDCDLDTGHFWGSQLVVQRQASSPALLS
jgi:hypothetical protein